MDGIVNFFKPIGMTSNQAVGFLKRVLKTKKVGHTGTLDPEVAGVLPLCVGRATKVAEYLLESDKEYIGQLTLGVATDTQDREGIVLETSNRQVGREEILNVFNQYKGDIDQIPPMYSALKYKGKKLYELARQGIEVERPARKVTIYSNEVLSIDENNILFKVACSKGTYIRTLCDDIGRDLGTLGYMSHLIRISSGPFEIKDSLSMEFLENFEANGFAVGDILIPMDKAIDHMDAIHLEDKLYKQVCNGMKLRVGARKDINEELRVYCRGEFIGIGSISKFDDEYILKMKKVLKL